MEDLVSGFFRNKNNNATLVWSVLGVPMGQPTSVRTPLKRPMYGGWLDTFWLTLVGTIKKDSRYYFALVGTRFCL